MHVQVHIHIKHTLFIFIEVVFGISVYARLLANFPVSIFHSLLNALQPFLVVDCCFFSVQEENAGVANVCIHFFFFSSLILYILDGDVPYILVQINSVECVAQTIFFRA